MTVAWWVLVGCRPPTASSPTDPHSSITLPTADTGAPRHSSTHPTASTGDTAAPPRVLPACDIPRIPRSQTTPLRVSVNDVRSAWLQAGDPAQPIVDGVPAAIVAASDGTKSLVVTLQERTYFFRVPVVGELALGDAYAAVVWESSNGQVDEHCVVDDWAGDAGEDVLIADGANGGPGIVSTPVPPGVHPLEEAADRKLDLSFMPGFPLFDGGDWNGDGLEDLLVAWDSGTEVFGPRYPPLPYPLGGAAIYLGPLPRRLYVTGTPAEAWYDAQSWDLGPPNSPYSGRYSRLIADVDSDGRDDVLLSGYRWPNLAERRPPEPATTSGEPTNTGGFAVFSGGAPGPNALGAERTLLAASCRSDQQGFLDIPTRASEVGDVDGDGVADLVLVADHVDLPEGYREVVFVVTRLPQLTGLHTYAEASGAVIVNPAEDARGFMAVVGVGDLNADGLEDLALAVFNDGVYVLLSPLSGFLDLDTAALRIVRNADGTDNFGLALASGDADGDGVTDLVISDILDRGCCGAVHVVSGQKMRDAVGL